MREYGQIQCAFWQHASEQGWSTDAMLLACYLLTGPHSNGVGTFRAPPGYVQDDLGWQRERVMETLSELSQNGFCKVFGQVVHIPKFLRWNAIANSNVAKARAKEFEAIPSDDAKAAAAASLLAYGDHWAKGFINRLETLSKGYSEQEPNQTNPNQTKPTQEGSAPASAPTPADTQPAKPASKPAGKRGTRIPDDFPDAAALEWARAQYPGIDAADEADTFRNHWTAKTGKDATKADWPATWKNWVKRAAKWQQERAPRQTGSGDDARRRVIEESKRLRASRGGAQ